MCAPYLVTEAVLCTNKHADYLTIIGYLLKICGGGSQLGDRHILSKS